MNDTSNPPLILLDELQQLTQHMLELIELGQIESLDEIEQQRQTLIKRYQASSLDEIPVMALREKLTLISKLDRELNKHCQVLREHLASQLKNIQNGKRVKEAYRENTP